MTAKYEAVLFDLLTALLDSWTVWDETAGSQARGRECVGVPFEIVVTSERAGGRT